MRMAVFLILIFILTSCQSPIEPVESSIQTPSISYSTQTPTPVISSATTTQTPIYSIINYCGIEEYQDSLGGTIRGRSPDGVWAFVDCHIDETHGFYVIANLENHNLSWVIRDNNFNSFPLYHPFCPWYAPSWDMDRNVVYLVYQDFCEYAIDCQYSDGDAVFQLNLSDKSLAEVLPDRVDGKDYAIDFSNDSRYLAYSINGTQILFIRDLVINEEIRIPFDPKMVTFGAIYWSPNDEYLAFQAGVFDYSYWLLRKDDFKLVQLLKSNINEFYLSGWVDEKTLLLWSCLAPKSEPNRYLYNIYTTELIVDTTPTPTPENP